jgi:hypothetical protein
MTPEAQFILWSQRHVLIRTASTERFASKRYFSVVHRVTIGTGDLAALVVFLGQKYTSGNEERQYSGTEFSAYAHVTSSYFLRPRTL